MLGKDLSTRATTKSTGHDEVLYVCPLASCCYCVQPQ